MLSTKELDDFYDEHCRYCGTQRCHGVFDEECAERCEHYQDALLQKESKPKNLDGLYDQFVEYINSMTREELFESARKAAETSAGCDDKWFDDLVQVVRCKDCKWRNTSGCMARWPVGVDDEGYCYGGER